MLELYQFELSHFCEKVRFILDYKNLPYRKVEVTPGIGQIELFRMSGQRQVPVLKDGNDTIAGSTAIAFYLDKKYPEKPLLPVDAQQRALTLMLEEWADASIALNGRTAMIGTFNQDSDFRKAFFPSQTPEAITKLVNNLPDSARNLGNLVASNIPNAVKTVIGAVPGEVLSVGGTVIGYGPEAVTAAKEDLAQNLEVLSIMLTEKPYLVADQPTLADFAVAGLSMYTKFPASPALDMPMSLKGKGIPGLADNPAYQTFFDWRDKLYLDFRKIDESRPPQAVPDTVPQKISID